MTPEEHIAEAERLLDKAHDTLPPQASAYAFRAQAHVAIAEYYARHGRTVSTVTPNVQPGTITDLTYLSGLPSGGWIGRSVFVVGEHPQHHPDWPDDAPPTPVGTS